MKSLAIAVVGTMPKSMITESIMQTILVYTFLVYFMGFYLLSGFEGIKKRRLSPSFEKLLNLHMSRHAAGSL